MFKRIGTQGIISKNLVDDDLKTWINGFLINRKAQGVSEGTIHFYKVKFKSFTRYCEEHLITNILQITQVEIREYLLWLEEVGINPDGSTIRTQTAPELHLKIKLPTGLATRSGSLINIHVEYLLI